MAKTTADDIKKGMLSEMFGKSAAPTVTLAAEAAQKAALVADTTEPKAFWQLALDLFNLREDIDKNFDSDNDKIDDKGEDYDGAGMLGVAGGLLLGVVAAGAFVVSAPLTVAAGIGALGLALLGGGVASYAGARKYAQALEDIGNEVDESYAAADKALTGAIRQMQARLIDMPASLRENFNGAYQISLQKSSALRQQQEEEKQTELMEKAASDAAAARSAASTAATVSIISSMRR